MFPCKETAKITITINIIKRFNSKITETVSTEIRIWSAAEFEPILRKKESKIDETEN